MRGKLFLVKVVLLAIMYFLITKITTGQTMPAGYNNAGKTIIWVVRGAENMEGLPAHVPQRLSSQGKRQAVDLAQYLQFIPVDICYTTSHTIKTIDPLLVKRKSKTEIYDQKDLPALYKRVMAEYRGKTALVVTDLEKMLELTEAFGGKRPIPLLRQTDYDFIFKITIHQNDDVFVEMDRYMTGHHVVEE